MVRTTLGQIQPSIPQWNYCWKILLYTIRYSISSLSDFTLAVKDYFFFVRYEYHVFSPRFSEFWDNPDQSNHVVPDDRMTICCCSKVDLLRVSCNIPMEIIIKSSTLLTVVNKVPLVLHKFKLLLAFFCTILLLSLNCIFLFLVDKVLAVQCSLNCSSSKSGGDQSVNWALNLWTNQGYCSIQMLIFLERIPVYNLHLICSII